MKIIKLKDGSDTVVDDDIYELVKNIKWRNSKGYAQGSIYGHRIYLHNLITNPPHGFYVDHTNGNPLDNLRCNLRVATQSQNNYNKPKQSRNTSGYKGVCKYKNRDRWYSEIKKDKKKYFIGSFSTKKEAAIAYNVTAKKLHGKFARLNEIR